MTAGMPIGIGSQPFPGSSCTAKGFWGEEVAPNGPLSSPVPSRRCLGSQAVLKRLLRAHVLNRVPMHAQNSPSFADYNSQYPPALRFLGVVVLESNCSKVSSEKKAIKLDSKFCSQMGFFFKKLKPSPSRSYSRSLSKSSCTGHRPAVPVGEEPQPRQGGLHPSQLSEDAAHGSHHYAGDDQPHLISG